MILIINLLTHKKENSMATSEQILRLIKAHNTNDNANFKTIVLQIAAYEASHGHDKITRELKKSIATMGNKPSNILSFDKNNINPLLSLSIETHKLNELIVSEEITLRINKILNEYMNRIKLKSYGMSNRRKILIEGKPGTGKTLTASVIAFELGLPLYTIQVDKLVSKFMGETSVKLRQIFDSIENSMGVYFFDEFDAIGADRSFDNEVGEMRRILNTFLQFIEQDSSESIIIAATNNSKLLDHALFRRFDDVLHYSMPTEIEIEKLYYKKFSIVESSFTPSTNLIKESLDLSHSEIISVCDNALKDSILENSKIDETNLLNLVKERKIAYNSKEA
jgi:AAA+ superfamily predicted ATPase